MHCTKLVTCACSWLHRVPSLRLLEDFAHRPMIDEFLHTTVTAREHRGEQISARAPSQTAQRLPGQDLPVSIGILLPKPDSKSNTKSTSVYVTLSR
jgi:hypothetical protein